MQTNCSEKAYENKIKKFLKDNGCFYIKYNPQQFGQAGTPDILACVGGRLVAIEVKRESGKISELQKYKIKEIIKAGGIAFVTRPSGFEDLKNFIEELLKHEIQSLTNRTIPKMPLGF
ncbi:VRR-NUC domain-containing protein [Gemella sp. 19428wG2_WT2a]|nr:VRR-NUC domain-containing protein [Gemella sp. 19428wG2_WT2a]TFU57714.1 VRR-NUC domain-containing protein [Gemella sp. WT2a]